MDIFIGNLPPQATTYDLRMLINRALSGTRRGRFFTRKPPQAEKIALQIVENSGMKSPRRFGHAVIEPDQLGVQCMMRLRGARLYGNLLSIHKYRERASMNERRALSWRRRQWASEERRLSERRARLVTRTSAA
ncbi:MAG: hypothetical protein AB1810_01490 [Pseudomonadota bacterium]